MRHGRHNEDRQNLLRGAYNEELIEAAAAMIAEELPALATEEDPARHLDALPRRHQGEDTEQADLLRQCLFSRLQNGDIVPDGDGLLRPADTLRYPPRELIRGRQTITLPMEQWAAFVNKPLDWLHHKAMTVNRLASIDRLFPGERVPGAMQSEWLEALTRGKSASGCSSSFHGRDSDSVRYSVRYSSAQQTSWQNCADGKRYLAGSPILSASFCPTRRA